LRDLGYVCTTPAIAKPHARTSGHLPLYLTAGSAEELLNHPQKAKQASADRSCPLKPLSHFKSSVLQPIDTLGKVGNLAGHPSRSFLKISEALGIQGL